MVSVLCLKLPYSLSELLYFLFCTSHMLTIGLDFSCPLILVFYFTFFELQFLSSFPPFSYTFCLFLHVSTKFQVRAECQRMLLLALTGENKQTNKQLCTWEICGNLFPSLMHHPVFLFYSYHRFRRYIF